MEKSTSFTTDSVTQAAKWLKEGQLLAYPTESVWGIGCDAYDEAAVQRILSIKRRPQAKGMIVITDSAERLKPLLEPLEEGQRQQIIKSWQANTDSIELQGKQAHTWLLPIPQTLEKTIPPWITGQHQTVAVRVIAHPMIRQLCQQLVDVQNPFGLLVSTSCNPSGQPPAMTFTDAYGYFGEQISYLQAETLGYTLPSQIRDATTGLVIR
ncbi:MULTISPECIES: L-threonylcarbamoyladenylate synthase [unclassified Psychrobacter]|uniref:L-threonylcarbamoyladenylate synthase n=1 Tax=unclassified Psychrobacter TaxID=196806 RepID=UPI000EBD3B44|nr:MULTISPECIES: L-threonylcarbamoyladenylate synthase [unclassified Psychrobacter]MBE8610151.1 L-threonylcarbamoyladenylate synthase [Pseudomonas lundensis]HCI74939.1 tRNA threonylcarbamoyladenosine biosynthesis protein RimN [Psychrobacter sp.]